MARVKLSVSVPAELHRRAKYVSFETGSTIQRVVEDALHKTLDPNSRPKAHELKRKETQMLIAQLREVVQSGNELLTNACVSCIRSAHALLKESERKVAQAPVIPMTPRDQDTKNRGRRKREDLTPDTLSGTS